MLRRWSSVTHYDSASKWLKEANAARDAGNLGTSLERAELARMHANESFDPRKRALQTAIAEFEVGVREMLSARADTIPAPEDCHAREP
jgi:hypothetical protein